MPKQKITKEMVVEAAFETAREKGVEGVGVKEIARKLNCSVQPIYSYCSSMEGLKRDLAKRAREFVQAYVAERTDREDFFRSIGHAYVQLASKEPYVFQMFVTQKRDGIDSLDALYKAEGNPDMAQNIADGLGITLSGARRLHQNMMIYNIGIGTILATARPGILAEEIYEQLENAYQAFWEQAVKEEEKEDA